MTGKPMEDMGSMGHDMPRDPADPAIGTYRMAAAPVSFSNYVQIPGPVHSVGEDTDEVMRSLQSLNSKC